MYVTVVYLTVYHICKLNFEDCVICYLDCFPGNKFYHGQKNIWPMLASIDHLIGSTDWVRVDWAGFKHGFYPNTAKNYWQSLHWVEPPIFLPPSLESRKSQLIAPQLGCLAPALPLRYCVASAKFELELELEWNKFRTITLSLRRPLCPTRYIDWKPLKKDIMCK